MKITNISVQARNPNRVNVFVDGKYRLSLDVYQVVELGIKNGVDVTPDDLAKWEEESQFGKLYGRALEYVMMRPHSAKEIHDYLWRKTLSRKVKKPVRSAGDSAKDYDVVDVPGVPQTIADRVYERLSDKGYIDDDKFTRFWMENRQQTKGISQRKLVAELRAKGVPSSIIEAQQSSTEREDESEVKKVINKKRSKYSEEKLIQYLLRQGFRYDTIKEALADDEV